MLTQPLSPVHFMRNSYWLEQTGDHDQEMPSYCDVFVYSQASMNFEVVQKWKARCEPALVQQQLLRIS